MIEILRKFSFNSSDLPNKNIQTNKFVNKVDFPLNIPLSLRKEFTAEEHLTKDSCDVPSKQQQ